MIEFMIEQALYFNIATNKWEIIEDPKFVSEDIQNLPFFIVLHYGKAIWIWCDKHNAFELVVEMEGMNIKSEKGCVFYGLPTLIYYRDGDCNFLWVHSVRYRIMREKNSPMVLVEQDLADITLFNTPISEDSARSALFTYSWYNPPLGIVPLFKKFVFNTSIYNFSKNANQDINTIKENSEKIRTVIVNFALDILEENYKIRSNATETDIYALLFRPFDLNCYKMQGYFGKMTFVPWDIKNAYHLFCKELNISPPKSLKKIYAKNPYAIIMYRTLLELGFTDYNLMLPFFDDVKIFKVNFRDSNKFNFPFLSSEGKIEDDIYNEFQNKYSCEGDVITQAEIDRLISGADAFYTNYSDWNELSFFAKWFIEEKDERFAAHRLLKYSKTELKGWEMDILSMLYQRYKDLSVEVRQMYIKKEFSYVLHNKLIEECNQLDYGHQEIIYTDFEKKWECEINGYTFKLPKYTDDIVFVGRKLHNCVASYIKEVMKNRCTIIALWKNNIPIACIEVTISRNKVNQALGDHNKILSGDVLHIVSFWMEKMSLTSNTDELTDPEYHMLPKDYFIYKK